MSKQKDSGALVELERVVNQWDYDASVKKMRPLVGEWKKATKEMLRELYFAKQFLSRQKGQYKDPDADNYLLYSWSSYCEEIGLTYQTANYLLKPFTPRELSNDQKDTLMIGAPAKTETTANTALLEARMEKVLRTGKRPSDWSAKEETEYKRRKESERFASLALKMNMPAVAATKRDYFADVFKHSKDIVNFKLADQHQIYAQAAIFDHIEAYLNEFKKPQDKVTAAFNIALKARNLANEIAESYFKSVDTSPATNEEHDGE